MKPKRELDHGAAGAGAVLQAGGRKGGEEEEEEKGEGGKGEDANKGVFYSD